MVLNLDHNVKAKMFGRVIQEQGAWHNGLEAAHYIVLYCTRGSIRMQIEKQELQVQPAQLLLIPKSTFYKPLAGGGCEYLFFHFDAEALPEDTPIPVRISVAPHTKLKQGHAYTCMEDYPSLVRLPLHTPAYGDVDRLFRQAEALRPGEHFADQLLLDVLLRQLLIEMGRASAPTGNRHLAQIRAYIEKHYANPLNLAALAGVFSLSQSYIARLFRTELGMKPSYYINRIRISAAKTMLLQTEHSVAEIAQAVGFSDIYYFSHVFKRYEGISPLNYKNSFRDPV